MKKAGRTGKRILYAALLGVSAFLMILAALLTYEAPLIDGYDASCRQADVTLLAPMAENWLLNAGDAQALDQLPGIGETLSERIIECRTQDGPFFFKEDVMAVKGIGEKTLEGILTWLQEHPEQVYVYPED